MRDYSKAAPTFWTGSTGRLIRKAGRDAQVVAFYLFSGPSSNWIGLYYLPLPTLCHEVGISKEGACKALRRLSEIDFAHYDEASEFVWVPGTAKFQIAESLKPNDNRILGIVKDLQRCENTEFVQDFIRRYKEPFCLPEIKLPDSASKPLARPFEGPPKPVTETEAVTEAVTEAETPILSNSKFGKKEKRRQTQEIFDFWNSQAGTMHHRAINGQQQAIEISLTHYTLEQIKTAIERYSIVRENKAGKYRDLYQWTLGEFLTRKNHYNLERFNAEQWEAPFLAKSFTGDMNATNTTDPSGKSQGDFFGSPKFDPSRIPKRD